jgi:hypothetical protein
VRVGTVRLSSKSESDRITQSHNPKVGGSNPPYATMNTAEMQWRSPVYRTFCFERSAKAASFMWVCVLATKEEGIEYFAWLQGSTDLI